MLFAISEAFSSIRDFMEQGGSVLWLIAILVFFMWGMIFERIWYLSHAYNEYVTTLAKQWKERSDKKSWHALQIREKMISQAKSEINKNLSIWLQMSLIAQRPYRPWLGELPLRHLQPLPLHLRLR